MCVVRVDCSSHGWRRNKRQPLPTKYQADRRPSRKTSHLAPGHRRPQAQTNHAAEARRNHRLDRTRREVPARRPAARRLLGQPETFEVDEHLRPPPGAHDAFRTAVTSLVIMALIEARAAVLPTTSGRPSTRRSTTAPSGSTSTLPSLKRATPDAIYNVWGHAYSIQCLVALAPTRRRQPRTPGQIERAGPTSGRHAGPLQLRRTAAGRTTISSPAHKRPATPRSASPPPPPSSRSNRASRSA